MFCWAMEAIFSSISSLGWADSSNLLYNPLQYLLNKMAATKAHTVIDLL